MALQKFCMTLALLFSLSVRAQKADTSFSKEWMDIDSLVITRNLTRTALEKVNTIYQKAQSQKLSGQAIKCLMYRYTLEDRIAEDDPNRIIKSIQPEINLTNNAVQKSILQVLLAKRLYQYFNNYRWRLYNRKTTVNFSKDDIATWGIADFHQAITKNFLQALSIKSLLQQTSLRAYDAIIIKGNKTRTSLYDLLAHEALDYFKSGDSYLTKPSYAFTIDNSNALGTIAVFQHSNFITHDSSAQQWMALQLFQQLIAVHSNDTDKNALTDLNIERIEWVYQQASFSNKEAAYVNALKEITTQHATTPAAAQAWYLLARLETSKAESYSPFGDTANRYGYAKAKQMMEQVLPAFQKNDPGVISMHNLLLEIGKRELSTQTERVNIPGKAFRAFISYRNIDTLYSRIIRIDNNETIRNRQWEEDYWKKVTRQRAYKVFTQALPATADHQLHTTEIKIDGLPVGSYALLSSNNPAFNDSSSKLCIQFFHVSDISYIRNKNDLFTLDRKNGKPLANVGITILAGTYNSELRDMAYSIIGAGVSDKNGYFRFTGDKNTGNIRYVFSKDKDKLDLKENDFIIYENNGQEEESEASINQFENNNRRVFFFTDRSVYRPGQTVYFKGIAVTRDPKTGLSKIVTRKDTDWVFLKDVNGKKVDSIRFTLTDYGSFSGKFRLPQNVLTGNFSIQLTKYNQSNIYFSVEEYKRPTFNITFDKAKGTYRLNDSITISGTAKAYAGNNLDGAKVVYAVKRNTRFLYPWLRRWPIPQAGSREISYGEIKTDADGRFVISFKALADDITDRSGNPLFDFSVSADITDINGETRSNHTVITIGYTALQLQINVPSLAEADSLKQIKLDVTNLDNEKETAKVQVKIYSLQPPNHLIRKRYWQRPDQFVMDRNEFAKYFPSDEYEEESNYLNWEAVQLVTTTTIDTRDKESVDITPGILQDGYYKIEAVTTDKYGEEVKGIRYTQLFNRNHNRPPFPVYQFNHTVTGTAAPGQTASFIGGTMADRLYVIRKIERPGNKTGIYSYMERTKGLETINYTPVETDRGGVGITEAFVYDNRVYTNQYYVTVPWNNKQLQVSYASYRNKTEPGSNEQWTVGIEGNKNENRAAELLTGMYDASLDQFRPHNWNAPNIWETKYWPNTFNAIHNFTTESAQENYFPEPYLQEVPVTYDYLTADAAEFWNRFQAKPAPPALTEKNQARAGYGVAESRAGAVMLRGAAVKQEVHYDKTMTPEDASDKKTLGPEEGDRMKIRKNFNETAFFLPHLYADSTGNYHFSFTMPEALTQWKWMSLAHTKDLAFGTATQSIITRKTLMVQPNMPRFLREGDNMELSAKIVNLGDKELTGQVTLELVDALTNTSIDGWFQHVFPVQYFTAEAGKSIAVKFPIQVPFSYNKPLIWRMIAKAGNFSDGEENMLPVVTNRTLVTESLPLLLLKDTTQSFRFEKLLAANSETLTHEAITIEYATNPVWYAVQSLPYLITYPYECAEQSFNRFYANALASYIVNKHPAIRQVLDLWKADSSALKSNLQKNEELKQLLIQETPWVLQAENETAQKKNIALLFNLVQLSTQADQFIEKLQQLQLPNGSFSWFKGGYEDRYMTNYILTGIGKLKRLGAITPDIVMRLKPLVTNAIQYLDGKITADYQWLISHKADLNKQQLSATHIQYLFMRSAFGDIAQPSSDAYQYFYNQGKQFWNQQSLYNQAMLGLVYYRNNERTLANNNILPSILENAVADAAKGILYWKERQTCFWYASPVEHQSMMIAFLQELQQGAHIKDIDQKISSAKTWLLLNKQTTNWKTTVATADACYALLLNGTGWLNTARKLTIRLGSYTVNNQNEKTEPGTGYFKKHIEGRSVTTAMGNITVHIQSADSRVAPSRDQEIPSWGSIYWQYFEDMDKITPAASPLSLTKKLFLEKNTDQGKVLDPVKDGDELKPGDKVVIRMELRSDRDMEYVHLKDMRAATMEPVNVLSSYKWQDGLGYYESTRDASTNFFISYLRKGTYIFEYPTFITHSGVFSVGIATIQCMYAPEFNSHSEGMKIRVR